MPAPNPPLIHTGGTETTVTVGCGSGCGGTRVKGRRREGAPAEDDLRAVDPGEPLGHEAKGRNSPSKTPSSGGIDAPSLVPWQMCSFWS